MLQKEAEEPSPSFTPASKNIDPYYGTWLNEREVLVGSLSQERKNEEGGMVHESISYRTDLGRGH
jgi:hypothetical protein